MSSSDQRSERTQRSTAPFVGREAELRLLRAGLESAIAGQAGVLLVAGEPGIGKTRLAEVFAADAGAAGMRALWGRCYEWEGAPAYWPWVQLLRAYIEQLDDGRLRAELGAGAADIAQILPDLRTRLEDLPQPPPTEPAQARFQLFEALTDFVRSAARAQPLLIVLEDLHWADTPSLLLFQFLAQGVRDAPVLLLGTFRDVEVDRQHPLSAALVSLARETHTERLSLKGLSRSDVRAFIEHLSGASASGALVSALHAETEGNPFFVGEITRLLVAEGRLNEPLQTPLRTIPEGIRGVIDRRLDRLSEACRGMLAVAAVIGREFSVPVLATVTRVDGVEVLDRLDAVVEARLIEVLEPLGHYQFSHALVQETLYAEVGTAARMQLHADVGEALEGFHRADLEPHCAELAYHFFNAAGHDGELARKAIAYALRAAERANMQVAWESAIVYYQMVLRVLEHAEVRDEPLRCETLLALGEAQNRAGAGAGQVIGAGNSAEAVATFMEAARVARAAGLAEHFAQAAFGIIGLSLSVAQGFIEASELMKEALDALPPSDSTLRAQLLAGYAAHRSALMAIAKLPMDPDAYAKLRAQADEAVAMARRLGDAAILSYTLHARCHVCFGHNDLDLLEADSRAAVDAARAAGDARLHALALFDVHQAALFRGDIDTARNTLGPLRQVAGPLKIRYFDYVLGISGAGQAIRDGRFVDAEGHIEFALSSWPRGGIATGLLFALRREQERVHEVIDALDWVTQQLPGALMWESLRVLARLELGRVDEARSLFNAIPRWDMRAVTSHWALRLCALYAEFSYVFADTDLAATVYERLAPYSHHHIFAPNSDYVCGSASHYLGLLATTLERWNDAERHLADALEANECWGYPLYAAYTRYAWADMLARRERKADRERIKALLADALAVANSVGSWRLVRLIEQLGRQASVNLPAVQPEAVNPAEQALSPREREVLAHIVAGRTDKQIADVLYISPRTVTTHVTNILNKLGVDSRVEAAALVTQNGRGGR